MRHLPAYLRLGWDLSREPAIAARHRAPLYLFPVYYVSPLHLVTHAIPILGQLDAPLLFLLGLRQVSLGGRRAS